MVMKRQSAVSIPQFPGSKASAQAGSKIGEVVGLAGESAVLGPREVSALIASLRPARAGLFLGCHGREGLLQSTAEISPIKQRTGLHLFPQCLLTCP